MEGTERIFTRAAFYDLLKGNNEVNLTQNAPYICIDHVEQLARLVRDSALEETKKGKRVTIKGRDVINVLDKFGLKYEEGQEGQRLPKAHVHRMLEGEHGYKIASYAVRALAGSLEDFIGQVGNLAALIVHAHRKKTIDESAIVRALESFSKDTSIPYPDFVEEFFGSEEIKKVCEAHQLPKSATKEELAKKCFNHGIPITEFLTGYSFEDIQAKMLKSKYPVPRDFQHIFEWVEAPPQRSEGTEDPERPGGAPKEKPGEGEPEPGSEPSLPSTENQQIQEEIKIIKEEMDYERFFTKDNKQLTLRDLVTELVSTRRLKTINATSDSEIEVTGNKVHVVDEFLRSGISVVYFLQELPIKHLKGLLRVLGLKLSGNKTDLIQRILSSVDFVDYDVTHEDTILLLKGKEFLEASKAEKQQEEIIRTKVRNYSGSIKLDLIKIFEECGFDARERDLKERYVKMGRDALSFFGVIGGLLRDGLVFVKPFESETHYYLPEKLQDPVRTALDEVRQKTAELEGIVSELPASTLLLLYHICGYGEKVDIMEVKEKFMQTYRSNQTWNKARQLLKERKLISEKYDEETERTVIHSPRLICPILSGILATRKTQLLEAGQEEVKKEAEQSTKEIPLEKYSPGIKDFLYLLVNSGGSVERSLLRTAFTTPPGVSYSDNSFLRFVRLLKKDDLIEEERDPDTQVMGVNLLYADLDRLKTELEDSLFDFQVESTFDSLPSSALALLYLILEEGGTIQRKKLRKKYLDYYSGTAFYKAFNLLDELLLTEGISKTGEYIVGIPGTLNAEVEEYFTKNPITLESKTPEGLNAEDFILNAYNPKALVRIADCYEIPPDLDDSIVVKTLLYEKQVPFVALAAELIPKIELIQFNKDHQIPHSGTKKNLVQRAIQADLFVIDENLVVEGELETREMEAALDTCQIEAPAKEKTTEEEIADSGPAGTLLDRDLIFEAISQNWLKNQLREESIRMDLRRSGTKKTFIEEIFFKSDLSYKDLFEKFLGDKEMAYIRKETSMPELTLETVIKAWQEGKLALPDKDVTYSLTQLLEILPKIDLKNIAKELGVRSGGNRAQLLDEITSESPSTPAEKVKAILRVVPEWASILNKNLTLGIDDRKPFQDILRKLGVDRPPELEEQDLPKSRQPVKVEKGFKGLITGIQAALSPDVIELGLEDAQTQSLKELQESSQVSKFFGALGKANIRKFIRTASLPIDLQTVNTTDLMVHEIFRVLELPPPTESLETITQSLAKLRLEYRGALAKGVSAFSRGEIKEGLNHLDKSEMKVFVREIPPKYYNDYSVQGIFFEAAVYHALRSLRTKNPADQGIKVVKALADFKNFQYKPEEADGHITIRVLSKDKLENFECLYDCKSRKASHSRRKDFLKFMDYLYLENKKRIKHQSGSPIQIFVVFSSEFSVSIPKLVEKIERKDEYQNYTLILWHATALRKLWRHNRDYQGVTKFFDWEVIFNRFKRVIVVDDDFIKKLNNKARLEWEKVEYSS